MIKNNREELRISGATPTMTPVEGEQKSPIMETKVSQITEIKRMSDSKNKSIRGSGGWLSCEYIF